MALDAADGFLAAELRLFSWGFEKEALFATRLRRAGAAASIAIRGQACTDVICKNIDVAFSLPTAAAVDSGAAQIHLENLVPVR